MIPASIIGDGATSVRACSTLATVRARVRAVGDTIRMPVVIIVSRRTWGSQVWRTTGVGATSAKACFLLDISRVSARKEAATTRRAVGTTAYQLRSGSLLIIAPRFSRLPNHRFRDSCPSPFARLSVPLLNFYPNFRCAAIRSPLVRRAGRNQQCNRLREVFQPLI